MLLFNDTISKANRKYSNNEKKK